MPYPKRLIEVDLPIRRVSARASKEKSARPGHISTLHIWWARRPLAACRAVICATLWLDPVDPLCPPLFREAAFRIMRTFAKEAMTSHIIKDEMLSEYTLGRLIAINQDNTSFITNNPNAHSILQQMLLDFIADFAGWDASSNPIFLKTARALTEEAHKALGGESGTRQIVVDPFAGGGAIPLEALRIGGDVIASDLNPLAVLLNKVVVEYVPRYGQHLTKEVQKWGEWVKKRAHKELQDFYPNDHDGMVPIAYLWSRTISCEGPGCGVEIPILRSPWLVKKGSNSRLLRIKGNRETRSVDLSISQGSKNDSGSGTVKRGAVTCPVCGFTTPVNSIRKQLTLRNGGTRDARLLSVVLGKPGAQGRFYRLPNDGDLESVSAATRELNIRIQSHQGKLGLIPDETLPFMSGVFNVPLYGMNTWDSLFTSRQLLCHAVLAEIISHVYDQIDDKEFASAVSLCLSFCLSKIVDRNSSLCTWQNTGEKIGHTFGRQALGMVWDFCESNMFSGATGSWDGAVRLVTAVLDNVSNFSIQSGTVLESDAKKLALPNDSCSILFTDPPYYNAVPYADLSDFFLVWMGRALGGSCPLLSHRTISPKEDELCEMAGWDPVRYPNKNSSYFENGMTEALKNARRLVSPNGLGVIVFAHKTTQGWEALLQAIMNAGWTITASWPLDTEFTGRLRAMGAATLTSSIHLVCRPRENPDGSVRSHDIGDWRDVLNELPKRIHEWMPRLAQEGVIGADAIFACLGPALEIFSRYSSVEKTNGDKVTLKEYLEQVWAAVAREALNMIFQGADASGFEEDARLTAMWLWTLRSPDTNGKATEAEEDDGNAQSTVKGYSLEYDAARKIAQGLGAHLESLVHLVEVKGETATLLSAGERTGYLFGKDATYVPRLRRRNAERQLTFDFAHALEDVEEESGLLPGSLSARPGATILDQLHQSMILFGAGRGEALKRFLVDEGVGQNSLFWRLAQSLSSLYPPASNEKRWVDGVMARKKGLGL